MTTVEHFRHCPRCGQFRDGDLARAPFECGSCGFAYYFNPAIAAGLILVNPAGQALFIRRAKEPARNKLAVPGGFIEAGETAEAGLQRELREELGLEVSSLEYLCSLPNQYHYREVTYRVLDLFYCATLREPLTHVTTCDEVASFCWLEPSQIDPEEFAFPSHRNALAAYLRKR